MSLQPRRRLNPRSVLSIPAAAHRLTIVPSCERFTLRVVVRPTEIIDSIGFVLVSVRARRSETPRQRTVNISSSPSRKLAAASGKRVSSWRARSFACRSPAEGSGWLNAVGEALVDPVALGLWQMVTKVPPLVQSAPLHEGLVAEDLAHR